MNYYKNYVILLLIYHDFIDMLAQIYHDFIEMLAMIYRDFKLEHQRNGPLM
jgi:hypothetical protein